MGDPVLSASDLQRLYEKLFSPWLQELGLTVVKCTAERTELRMHVAERLNRDGGIVSGQALMAVADTAMVLAIFAARGEPVSCASVNISTNFLKPATNVELRVVANIARFGRSIVFATVEILSSVDEKLVLTASGTYALPPP